MSTRCLVQRFPSNYDAMLCWRWGLGVGASASTVCMSCVCSVQAGCAAGVYDVGVLGQYLQ